MAWSTHPTVSFQESWSFSNQNEYVKGNLDYIATSNYVRLWPGATAYAPLSTIDAAGIEVNESGSTGSPLPVLPQITFDESTDEGRMFVFAMPRDYVQDPVVRGQYKMASTSTGDVIMVAQIAALTSGDSAVSDPEFASANSVTESAPTTADDMGDFSITLTNDDGLSAGDWACLLVYRDADNASDTSTGDLDLLTLELRYDYD